MEYTSEVLAGVGIAIALVSTAIGWVQLGRMPKRRATERTPGCTLIIGVDTYKDLKRLP